MVGAGRALTMQDMRFREELKWNLRMMVTVSFTPFLGLLSTPLSWLHPAARQHCSIADGEHSAKLSSTVSIGN